MGVFRTPGSPLDGIRSGVPDSRVLCVWPARQLRCPRYAHSKSRRIPNCEAAALANLHADSCVHIRRVRGRCVAGELARRLFAINLRVLRLSILAFTLVSCNDLDCMTIHRTTTH